MKDIDLLKACLGKYYQHSYPLSSLQGGLAKAISASERALHGRAGQLQMERCRTLNYGTWSLKCDGPAIMYNLHQDDLPR